MKNDVSFESNTEAMQWYRDRLIEIGAELGLPEGYDFREILPAIQKLKGMA